MKKPTLTLVLISYFLLGCSNWKTQSQPKNTLTSTIVGEQNVLPTDEKKKI